MPHKNYRRTYERKPKYTVREETGEERRSRRRKARTETLPPPEYDHLRQHCFFLEERVTDLEFKVEQIRDVFGYLLGIEEEEP